MDNTIFVQIASYKDPELLPTLNDIIDKAKHPEALHIGISWQHNEEETLEDFMENGFDVTGFEDDITYLEDYDRVNAVISVTKGGAK